MRQTKLHCSRNFNILSVSRYFLFSVFSIGFWEQAKKENFIKNVFIINQLKKKNIFNFRTI